MQVSKPVFRLGVCDPQSCTSNHFFTALLLKLRILNLKYVENIQTSHWQHLVETFFSATYRITVLLEEWWKGLGLQFPHFTYEGIFCLTPRWVFSSSFQFSRSVMSDSLQPHESQHSSPPCPSPTPGVYSNSCPLSQVMQSSHLILCRPLLIQFLPASGSFPMSQLFA